MSSARNRGLHHAKGDYICFLDADDIRAPWAFTEVAKTIEKTQAELVLVRGGYSGECTPLTPFFDTAQALSFEEERDTTGIADLAMRKAWTTSCEPQSANKFIAQAVIKHSKLRFHQGLGPATAIRRGFNVEVIIADQAHFGVAIPARLIKQGRRVTCRRCVDL